MDRRRFAQASLLGLAATAQGAGTGAPQPPPFRLIYSNDTTHITSNRNPWRNPADGFTDGHVRASIREAAGADAHFLQPGLGWIPWWQSRLYSPREHFEGFLEKYGPVKPHAVGRYLLGGGDLLATLVDECRLLGVAPVLSFRLNDGHHVRGLKAALEGGRPSQDMSRFYWENYSRYRLGPDPANWDDGVFDWAIPEVRAHKFDLIAEACAGYPLAGLELDFLRHWNRFSPERTPEQERIAVTTGFVRDVRGMLDGLQGKDGRQRWLGIRVPARTEIHATQGIDLAALAQAGVDFVTLSYSYFTVQDHRVAEVRALIPHTPVYLEMTHTTMTGPALAGSGTQPYLRTTDAEFFTTARLAREQGAAGLSLFNFPYFREHGLPELGPFTEPPFHVLPQLNDNAFLACQPGCYFLTQCRRDPILGPWPLPALLKPQEERTFALTLLAEDPAGADGLLRLRAFRAIAGSMLEVSINGQALEPAPFVAKPVDHPYEAYLGSPDEFACFRCPRSAIRPGESLVAVRLREGAGVKLIAIDLTFS